MAVEVQHKDLTGDQLHECKGFDESEPGQFRVAGVDGAGRMVFLPQGFVKVSGFGSYLYTSTPQVMLFNGIGGVRTDGAPQVYASQEVDPWFDNTSLAALTPQDVFMVTIEVTSEGVSATPMYLFIEADAGGDVTVTDRVAGANIVIPPSTTPKVASTTFTVAANANAVANGIRFFVSTEDVQPPDAGVTIAYPTITITRIAGGETR